jgi:hypothetical protein
MAHTPSALQRIVRSALDELGGLVKFGIEAYDHG